jgi:hypothetical protein
MAGAKGVADDFRSNGRPLAVRGPRFVRLLSHLPFRKNFFPAHPFIKGL